MVEIWQCKSKLMYTLTSWCFFFEESPPSHENIFRGLICPAAALPEKTLQTYTLHTERYRNNNTYSQFWISTVGTLLTGNTRCFRRKHKQWDWQTNRSLRQSIVGLDFCWSLILINSSLSEKFKSQNTIPIPTRKPRTFFTNHVGKHNFRTWNPTSWSNRFAEKNDSKTSKNSNQVPW